jgi:hypothetical protein
MEDAMRYTNYNPFSKPCDALETKDLAVLRHISEGVHIEYNQDTTSIERVAQSLASFANQEGGWLFYGITQALDTSPTARLFLGIAQVEMPRFIEQVETAARTLLHPHPSYEYTVLQGPCPVIGLPAERSILAVMVPAGIACPYIHTDGRIYYRLADSSNPVYVTDQATLSQMWERKGPEETPQSHSGQESMHSQNQDDGDSDGSFLHLFLLSDPTNPDWYQSYLDLQEFADIMSERHILAENDTITPPFTTSFMMTDGFIARHVVETQPEKLVFTWKHYQNGSSVISLPLRTYMQDRPMFERTLHTYAYAQEFVQALHTHKQWDKAIIDLHTIILLILSCIIKHIQLIERGQVGGTIFVKVAFDQLWSIRPFADTHRFVSYIQEQGFPPTPEPEPFSLAAVDVKELLQLHYPSPISAPPLTPEQLSLVAPVFSPIEEAFGLPPSMVVPDELFEGLKRLLMLLQQKET